MSEAGYRDDLGTVLHDMDRNHVVFDFLTDGSLDSYRTGWAPGVWDESWEKRPAVPMVWNHNPDVVIGSAVRKENLGDRARVVNRFADFDRVPKAREVHSLIADGHLTSASYHFRNGVSKDHPRHRGARLYTKADMLETSPVTFGSGVGRVAGFRSAAHLQGLDLDDLLRLWNSLDRREQRRRLRQGVALDLMIGQSRRQAEVEAGLRQAAVESLEAADFAAWVDSLIARHRR